MASHAHPHDRVPGLALREQFDTVEQQRDASTLGMWIFLITEVMFFGGMFTAYTAYRTFYPDVFARASNFLDATIGALNTAVLLTSSLTMAMAVRAAQLGMRKALVWLLLATILFGGVFLGVKAVEWNHKYHEHHIPGPHFRWEGPQAGQAELFFGLYFGMTGLHALHMVVGIGILAVLAWQASRGRFGPEYNTPVDVSGLYWHFVDIIWIFLFPLLYLVGRHHHA